jgi:type IV fimbrial biogenesis protein FimT
MGMQLFNSADSQKAFTLIELLITLSVLGVLLAIALPNLQTFVVNNRLSSNANSFIGLINYARSEAIARNQSVIICPKVDAGITCAGDQQWGKYELQVFVDCTANGDRNSAATVDCPDGDTLIKTYPAIDSSGTNFVLDRSAVGNIRFNAGGISQTAHTFAINAKGDTDYEIKFGRTICISRPGRARVIPPLTSGTCSAF